MTSLEQIFRVTLLGMLALILSACANMQQKKGGEFDYFLENQKGESLDTTQVDADSKVKDAKEAKSKANAALQAGNLENALIYFVKALEADNKDQEALLGIATIHDRMGNYSLAIMAYRMCIKENEDNLDAEQGLGLALIRVNQYDEARMVLLRALKDNPQRARIYNGLGIISDLQRFFDEARWFYTQALTIDPNSPITQTNIAYSYYLSSEWDKAERLFKIVLDRFPEHQPALLNYGLLLARKDQLFDAQTMFEKVLGKANAYNELGYILMLDKKYTQAEQLFQKAISESPTYFEKAQNNLKRLHELQTRTAGNNTP